MAALEAVSTAIDPELIGRGLAQRLHQLMAAFERYDSFVFRPGASAGATAGATVLLADEAGPAAKALVLRALRCCGDTACWQVMERLAVADATTGELAVLLGCPRLIAWEQVNELVQAGLAARDLDGDRVGLTSAGRGMAELVEALTEAAARPAASGTGREPR